MHVVAVANSKGGAGKTSVAVNLSVGWAAGGARVLLVDLDPGGHATTWLRGDKAETGIAEALVAGQLQPEHVVNIRDELWLAPASPLLDGIELALANEFARETILSNVVRAKRTPQFDVVVLDCPPSTGFLSRSAIYASDGVVVPVLPGYMSLGGVVDIRTLIAAVRKRSRSKVSLLGCVIFGADEREMVGEETRETLRRLDGTHLYTSEVRVSAQGKRSPETRATAWDPGADSRGREDYAAVLKETNRRLESR